MILNDLWLIACTTLDPLPQDHPFHLSMLEGHLNGRRMHMNAIESPFRRDEDQLLEASYFNKLTGKKK